MIYGIVLSPDGYIATKASELHSYRDLTIRVGSSKYGQFREIGSDPSTDIAVVKVEAAGLHAPGPVSNDAAMGTLVVSNGSTTRTSRRPQLGTLSAEQRPIPNGDTAYLGVVFGTPVPFRKLPRTAPPPKPEPRPEMRFWRWTARPLLLWTPFPFCPGKSWRKSDTGSQTQG